MKTSMALLFATIALNASAGQPLDYRFDSVKRTVTVTSSGKEQRAAKGAHARSGDQVETGWFSSALIASDDQHARFEIFSATQVTLASDTPGVILTLERGRIRAAFDKITGSEPRIVKTPGALLAVRGTQFDVHVDAEGRTTVDVFEGLVEVQSPLRHEPLFVRPGEEARFGRNEPPTSRPMPEQRRRDNENREQQPQHNRDGERNRDRDSGHAPQRQSPPPQKKPPAN